MSCCTFTFQICVCLRKIQKKIWSLGYFTVLIYCKAIYLLSFVDKIQEKINHCRIKLLFLIWQHLSNQISIFTCFPAHRSFPFMINTVEMCLLRFQQQCLWFNFLCMDSPLSTLSSQLYILGEIVSFSFSLGAVGSQLGSFVHTFLQSVFILLCYLASHKNFHNDSNQCFPLSWTVHKDFHNISAVNQHRWYNKLMRNRNFRCLTLTSA